MSGAEIAIASAVVGVGSTIYGASKSADALGESKRAQLMAAQEQSTAYEFEGGQLDLQAKRQRSAAAADEAARRAEFESSLETIDAFRSSRGLDLDSPTGRAIRAGMIESAEHGIQTARSNYMIAAAQTEMQAELSRRKARFSLIAGDAAGRATDAQIGATWAGGIGKVAGIGMDLGKTLSAPKPAGA